MLIIFIALYLIITFVLTVMGIERQTEGLKLFFISLLLTPLAGIIYYYSKKNRTSDIHYYYCEECGYIYPVKMKNCPICAEKGIKVKLKKYHSPYNVKNEIEKLNLAS